MYVGIYLRKSKNKFYQGTEFGRNVVSVPDEKILFRQSCNW
jgi:hypothetical protein